MSVCLLDVNVLIALAWPSHILHERVIRWFGKQTGRAWATCPFAQTTFVRILANPAFSLASLSPSNAVELLERNVAHPGHQFCPANITFKKALEIARTRLTGHQQASDVYLLGLAIHNKGVLATCDSGLAARGFGLHGGPSSVGRIDRAAFLIYIISVIGHSMDQIVRPTETPSIR